jgi:hypothetical protein
MIFGIFKTIAKQLMSVRIVTSFANSIFKQGPIDEWSTLMFVCVCVCVEAHLCAYYLFYITLLQHTHRHSNVCVFHINAIE